MQDDLGIASYIYIYSNRRKSNGMHTHMAKVEKQRKCAMYLKIPGDHASVSWVRISGNTHLSYVDVCWQGGMHDKRMSGEKTGVEMIKGHGFGPCSRIALRPYGFRFYKGVFSKETEQFGLVFFLPGSSLVSRQAQCHYLSSWGWLHCGVAD